MIKNKKFSTKEVVILAISLISFIGIFPFCIIRFINKEWTIAVFDLILSLLSIFIFLYVWNTHKTTLAKYILSALFVFASLATIELKGVVQIPWLFPSMIGVFFLLDRKVGLFVNMISLTVSLFMLSDKLPLIQLLTFIVTIVSTNLFAFAFSLQNYRQQKKLVSIARKDPLTGVLNRRAFNEAINEIVMRQNRNFTSQSLILLDIDEFKAINDEWGHDIGDEVLINLTKAILKKLRKTDRLFRIGGEEFAILPYETNQEMSANIAENIRIAIEQSQLLTNKTVTISLGIATYQSGESYPQWFKRADRALYEAKEKGKNILCGQLSDADESKLKQVNISAS
ncbi:GGDEF domain-containing protein [Colwelliaceae bacterium 6471]